MRVRGFACGWLSADRSLFAAGSTGRFRVPVPAFLIEHRGSMVVFDAGLHPGLAADPRARRGSLADVYHCEQPPGTRLDERLESCGVDPDDVDLLVLSHLHVDHVGGALLLPRARLLVQRAEWAAAVGDTGRVRYSPADFDCGHDRQLVDGCEHDVFGDGRVVLVPTPGHTAGHQSLRLRTDRGEEVVLCADACYFREALAGRLLPPFAFDADRQRSGTDRLAEFEAAGARLVFGHDPEQWPADGGVLEC